MTDPLSPRYWRSSEEDLLRREYPRGGAKHVARLLPHRSPGAITMRAIVLGVRAGYHWSSQEIETLRTEYPRGGLALVEARLPTRSRKGIRHQILKLGLRRAPRASAR